MKPEKHNDYDRIKKYSDDLARKANEYDNTPPKEKEGTTGNLVGYTIADTKAVGCECKCHDNITEELKICKECNCNPTPN